MRLRVIVFRAVGTIEIAFVGEVKTTLKRLAVEKPFPGFEKIVAGKFAADFIEQVHVIRKRLLTLRGLDAAVTPDLWRSLLPRNRLQSKIASLLRKFLVPAPERKRRRLRAIPFNSRDRATNAVVVPLPISEVWESFILTNKLSRRAAAQPDRQHRLVGHG